LIENSSKKISVGRRKKSTGGNRNFPSYSKHLKNSEYDLAGAISIGQGESSLNSDRTSKSINSKFSKFSRLSSGLSSRASSHYLMNNMSRASSKEYKYESDEHGVERNFKRKSKNERLNGNAESVNGRGRFQSENNSIQG
jgi:hypothetical protein